MSLSSRVRTSPQRYRRRPPSVYLKDRPGVWIVHGRDASPPLSRRRRSTTLRPVAGDPLGELRPSKDESLDEWGERQTWASAPKPDPSADKAELVLRVAAAIAFAVLLVVLLILEVL